MFKKINPASLIADHLTTLRDFRTGARKASDIVGFFGLPVVIAAGFLIVGPIEDRVRELFVTTFSIFGALLLSVLIVLYELSTRKAEGESIGNIRKKLISETYANTAFAILTSIVALVALMVMALLTDSEIVVMITSAVVYYLTGVFVLTMLMILKRMHALLTRELEG